MASQRSSLGVRFPCRPRLQMTQSRPRSESNARRRPMGKCSMVSLASSAAWQKMHVEYIRFEYVGLYGGWRALLAGSRRPTAAGYCRVLLAAAIIAAGRPVALLLPGAF